MDAAGAPEIHRWAKGFRQELEESKDGQNFGEKKKISKNQNWQRKLAKKKEKNSTSQNSLQNWKKSLSNLRLSWTPRGGPTRLEESTLVLTYFLRSTIQVEEYIGTRTGA